MANESRSRLGRLLAEVARRPLDVVLHELGCRGQRERDQARADVHRPTQDRRALSLVPRRLARRDLAHGRPASVAERARDAGRRPHVRPVHVPLPGGASRPLSCLHGRATWRRSSSTRAGDRRRGVHGDRDGDERRHPPPDGYLQAIREVCDRHGILLVFDEVMAGFGRTGRWFACENWDVVPDIITVAKGINSGYVPLGAMIFRKHIADWVRDKFFPGGPDVRGTPAGLLPRWLDRGVPGRRRRGERRRGRLVPGSRLTRAR